ncbi:BLUF domain-containing protein [Paludibacterium paludis]|uniref:BLUF domain-containing protein n=1 Tax=Paludibacterium paludis TaxID=1225769 RepID=A0A918P0G1_9NEIS|nr:BLUF domain-containing protein [Paludibacterium paludis]GGY10450.1 hypothetical protein GCM10011289_11500 [Paludibacterium paludis]
MLRLIYTSHARPALSAASLPALVEHWRRHNAVHDITGLLVHAHEAFLQILEGPDAAVGELFSEIRKDSRHTRLRLLCREYADERIFPGWNMGLICQTPEAAPQDDLADMADAGLFNPGGSQAMELARLFLAGHGGDAAGGR